MKLSIQFILNVKDYLKANKNEISNEYILTKICLTKQTKREINRI